MMQTSDWDKINLAMLNQIHSEDDQPSQLGQTQKNNKIEAGVGWKSQDGVQEYFNISHHDPYFIRKDSVENNSSCGDKKLICNNQSSNCQAQVQILSPNTLVSLNMKAIFQLTSLSPYLSFNKSKSNI